MPIRDKYSYALVLTRECLVPVDRNKNEFAMRLSPLWKEDNVAKAILLHNILAGYYFDIEVPAEKSTAFFDECGETAFMNCLERYKSDPALKDKIFDIIYDFKEFKKLVDAEIYQEKQRRNDPINRLLENIAAVTSPENMEERNKEMMKVIGEIDKITKEGLPAAQETGTAE